jgi:hypothetical protein
MDAATAHPSSMGKTLLEHSSAHGSTVTHIRGILLANAQRNMMEYGVYELYLKLLPPKVRGHLEGVIASSWIDMEVALVHYTTAELIAVRENIDPLTAAESVGSRLAERISQTFMGAAVKTARNGGLEAYLFVMKQNHRVWDRIYKGGGTAVFQRGPKEIVLEDRGLPLLGCSVFRMGYLAYLKAMAALFCRAAFVNPAPPRCRNPNTIATRVSWV